MRTEGPIFITQPFQYMRFSRGSGPDELIEENLAKFVWGAVDPQESDPLKVTNYFMDGFLKRQLTLSSIYMESMRHQDFDDTVNKAMQYFPFYENMWKSGAWMALLRAAIHFNVSVYSFEVDDTDQGKSFFAKAVNLFNGVDEPLGSEVQQYYNFIGAALERLSGQAGVSFSWDRPVALDALDTEVPALIGQLVKRLEDGGLEYTKAKWGTTEEYEALAVALDLKRRGMYAASIKTYLDGLSTGAVVSFDTLRGMYKTAVAASYVVSALQLLAAARKSIEADPEHEPTTWQTSEKFGQPYRPFQEDFENLTGSLQSPNGAINFMQGVSGNSRFELTRPIQVIMDEWNGPLALSLRKQLAEQ